MTTIAAGRTSRRVASTAAILALALASCGGTDDLPAPPTTTAVPSTTEAPTTTAASDDTAGADDGATTSSTSTTGAGADRAEACPSGATSSSEVLDPTEGTVAALIVTYDAPELEIDPIAWFVGEDAVDAYLEDNPGETDGPPNDVYTRNEDLTLRTAPLADDATISLLAFDDGVVNVPATASELADRLDEPSGPFWITLEDGAIVAVCEQYTP
jgi:hypothetical protein